MLQSYPSSIKQMNKKGKASEARINAVKLLCEFNKNMKPLNLLLQDFRQDMRPDQKEQSFVSELIYGSVRWRIQSDWILGQFVHGKLNEYPIEVREILRCSIYQLHHLKTIPGYAVLNEAFMLARYFRRIKYARLINGVLRNYLRNRHRIRFPGKEPDLISWFSVNYAFPAWMVELLLQQYDSNTIEHILNSLNQRPRLTLRVNLKKIATYEYQQKISDKNIDFQPGKYLPEYLVLNNFKGSVKDLPGYYEGWFSVQDESAGFSAHCLMRTSPDKIVDVCAAPGGKITHLAQLSDNNKTLFALDQSFGRLGKVLDNLNRLGIQNVKVLQGDGTKLPLNECDAVLIDAPCSGLGVIRKNPDIKIRRNPIDVNNIQKLQSKLLKEADKVLKFGGILIYNTCTINKNENQKMIESFLLSNQHYSIEKMDDFGDLSGNYLNTVSEIDTMDGVFCVSLKKGKLNGK